ncbi:MAG: hypothetical protein NTV01_02430 [Bacteroidia bacterium]|nr:hypothetical protein [Bacteroidia bacterium]
MAEKKYGIIGTVLFHMFVLAIILFIKVDNMHSAQDNIIFIDLKVFEDIQKLEAEKPDPANLNKSPTRQARNIAVNQAEDRIEKYDDYKNYQVSNRAIDREVQKRVSQAERDIISENNLNPNDKELPIAETKPIDFYKASKIVEEQVYKGPTNIYFELKDRKVAYLPIPVYKCKGGGTVRVDIRVSQRGKVEWTTINNPGTDTQDPCFLDAAKDAALRTRFNFSTAAIALQQGYIIYHFVAQ